MALSKVFDKKNISLYTALDKICQSGRFHAVITDNWKRRIQEIEPTIEKVFVLRSCIYAHLSIKLDTVAAFKKADITPDDFKHAIESTLEIWQLMNGMTEQVPSVFLDRGIEDVTRELLLDLKKVQTSRQAN